MTHRPNPGRAQRRAAHRRERVLRATRELVAEGGFGAASARRIAGEAEVAVGSVYEYFGNRGRLLAEVFRRAATAEVDRAREAIASAGPDASSRIDAALRTFAGRALAARTMAEALLFEPVEPAVEQERLRFRRVHHDLFADIVREGIATGELPHQDPDLTARALIGASAEALMGRLGKPHDSETQDLSPAVRDAHLDHITTFCIRAMGGQS